MVFSTGDSMVLATLVVFLYFDVIKSVLFGIVQLLRNIMICACRSSCALPLF